MAGTTPDISCDDQVVDGVARLRRISPGRGARRSQRLDVPPVATAKPSPVPDRAHGNSVALDAREFPANDAPSAIEPTDPVTSPCRGGRSAPRACGDRHGWRAFVRDGRRRTLSRMAPRRTAEPAPRKSLGQHFLRDTGVRRDIVEAVRVPDGGLIVEIGAGTGELTAALLAAGHEVAAIEIEERLVRHLEKTFARQTRLRVIQGDARDIDLADVVPEGRPFAVVGNLPYFAANPIVRHLLEGERKPTDIVIMLQREVAKRIVAGDGKLSLLAVSVHVYAEPHMLFDVPPQAFDPPPKVWSSVIRLTPRAEPLVPRERIAEFFDLVVKTFRNPRKQLHNALARGVWLPRGGAQEALAAAGIDGMRRPETLCIAEWLQLLDHVGEVRADAS